MIEVRSVRKHHLDTTFVDRAEHQGFTFRIQVRVLTTEVVHHGQQLQLVRRVGIIRGFPHVKVEAENKTRSDV